MAKGVAVTARGEAAEAWALWDKLKRLFPAWNLLLEAFYTPGAWGYMGVDFLNGFRRNPSTAKAFALLDGIDDATFDALSALASLNARRHDQMVRAVVVVYLTVPLTIAAIMADLAGDSMLSFIRAHSTVAIQVAAGVTLGPISYLQGQWRSRQILGVLDLIRIERGQAPFTALELREE
ncbi:hypothetical protein [Caulobacter sp. 602-1]|uniref:hypothetical protein n=1 Tax=Caulobacter sp. 602-1 TaxID=2492472 RepID=UPI000F633453|nr:hypothetical protein [Caulobacter sp. 602-1]RRN62610.1 hypothetical protein EIK80_21215 [Caulobacter sp. 602-1]